jgi:hypothetical protein
MKNKYKKISFILCSILFIGCDKSDSDLGNVLSDVYVPDFSNDWTVVKGNASGDFFLNIGVVDSTKGTGVFSGSNEELSSTLLVSGSFVNTKVKLTISSDSLNPGTPPLADSSFSGIYDTLSTPHHMLRLVNNASPHDSLVLQHG